MAAECRRPCGPMSGAPGVPATAACTVRRASRASSRRPRAPSSSAGPESGVARAGRPRVSQASSGPLGRDPVGNAPLLPSLAQDAEQAAAAVHVVDVEADQLADPDAAGVQQLEHHRVAQRDRFLGTGRGLDHRAGLLGGEHAGERPVSLGADQPESDVVGRETRPTEPGRERAGRGRVPGGGRPAVAAGPPLRQPAAQRREVELVDLGPAPPGEVLQQPDGVGDVPADRVRGQVALGAQVVLVPVQGLRQRRWQRGARVCCPGGHPGTVRRRRGDRQAAAPGPAPPSAAGRGGRGAHGPRPTRRRAPPRIRMAADPGRAHELPPP